MLSVVLIYATDLMPTNFDKELTTLSDGQPLTYFSETIVQHDHPLRVE